MEYEFATDSDCKEVIEPRVMVVIERTTLAKKLEILLEDFTCIVGISLLIFRWPEQCVHRYYEGRTENWPYS